MLPCSYDVPLVADIHFQPTVAMMVAEAFEKIRINPGNFADGRKSFEVINYDDPAQFRAEQEHIREVSSILLDTCWHISITARAGHLTRMQNQKDSEHNSWLMCDAYHADLHAPGGEVQAPQQSDAHRDQSRLAQRAHSVLLW